MHARAVVRARRLRLAASLLLAAVQAVLLARTAWDKSDTVDEPHYLAQAVRMWTLGDLRSNCDSPALPKRFYSLALRVADPPVFDPAAVTGRDPLWSRPPAQARRNLFAARCTTIAFTVLTGLVLAAAASRFGQVAALVTHASWCFSPTLLAHGSLATLDAWVTGMLVIALWAAHRLWDRPGPGTAALLGAGLGLAAACKVTSLAALPFAAAALLLSLRRDAGGPAPMGRTRQTLVLLLPGLAFVLALWAVYGFESGPVRGDDVCGWGRGPVSARIPFCPFPSWVEGLIVQLFIGRTGHLGYLFGVVGEGWWWFYLAAFALKTTIGAQLLGLGALATWLAGRPTGREWRGWALRLGFPTLLIVGMSLGNAQNGIKYVLPSFPFFMLFAGAMAQRAVETRGRRAALVTAALLAASTAESLSVHPHHLMFFNRWIGGPANGPRYLVVGDDWGQDQRRLAEWQARERPWRLFYTFYNGRPQNWGITYQKPTCQPQTGFYALHAVELHRPKHMPPGCLDWLTVEPPDDRLGWSIYLYQVTRARLDRLAAERDRPDPFWRAGPTPGSDGEEEEPRAESP